MAATGGSGVVGAPAAGSGRRRSSDHAALGFAAHFSELGSPLPTERILGALTADENRPWQEYDHRGPLTAGKMSKLLRDVGIGSRRMRFATLDNLRGYAVEWFKEVFDTYLEPEHAEQTEHVIEKERAIK